MGKKGGQTIPSGANEGVVRQAKGSEPVYTKLSEACIWSMLETVYKNGGKELWEKVPFYITSSTFIAESYAEMVISFLLDCHSNLNTKEPIYIIELGTGTGCFSFYLQKEIARKRMFFSKIDQLKIIYIMTDVSSKSINGWQKSDVFASFVKNGLLEFAIFKPEEQTEFTTYSGIRISPETIQNPIFVIGNYFFDSLRQDAFRVDNHELQEARHAFSIPPGVAEDDPKIFELLQKKETYHTIDGKYYDDECKNMVLRNYADELDHASVLFPVGALDCVSNLRKMSNDRMVLITTDKGYCNAKAMEGLWEQPFCGHDGVFSYSVNFDAISRYISLFGGRSYNTDLGAFPVETNLSIVMKDLPSLDFPHTRYFFEEILVRKNPINYVNVCENFISPHVKYDANEMIKSYVAFVRMANNDPIAFYLCFEAIMERITEIDKENTRVLIATMKEVENNFFHASSRYDVLYQIGKTRYMLDQYDDALISLKRSLQLFGESSYTLFYIAACYEVQSDYLLALEYYQRSLDLDPSCEITKRAIERMKSRIMWTGKTKDPNTNSRKDIPQPWGTWSVNWKPITSTDLRRSR